jgi:immune inhibitor A
VLDGASTDAELSAAGAPAVEGTLRLLAIAVEFDGSDTVESFSHEDGIRSGRCITETVTYTGPRHNEIKAPGPLDNNTFWMPAFEKDFFEKIILSETGITERVRLDLVDPSDGQPGIDLAGLTMANYFREVSGGRLSFDAGPAGIQAWVKVPHSVGYYAANSCRNGRVSGSGLTSNPRFPAGMSQLIADIATAINAANPDFPWADYDTDGNGLIDHVQLFHAGIDESEGGGIHGQQQIWAHRGAAPTASAARAGGRPRHAGYGGRHRTARLHHQPENWNLGVLVHEFGHDLRPAGPVYQHRQRTRSGGTSCPPAATPAA